MEPPLETASEVEESYEGKTMFKNQETEGNQKEPDWKKDGYEREMVMVLF